VGSVLVLVARPAAVIASTLPLRVPWRQQAFLSWAGLRGAVPIVLATIPVSAHLPGATYLFDLVFVVVVVFTLVQGPTLVVAAAGVRDRTERRLRAVSRGGRLAGWFGEHGR
jgi:potassium/hydrogen antiporter